MNKIKLEDVFELSDIVYDLQSAGEDVCVVAPLEEIKIIFKELILMKPDYNLVDISMETNGSYDKEYMLCVGDDGIFVEEAYSNIVNDYKIVGTDTLFINSSNPGQIVERVDAGTVIVYTFVEEDEDMCDGDCENCSVYEDDKKYENEDDAKIIMPGFTMSGYDDRTNSTWSKSFYSNDKELVKYMADLWK